MVVTANDVIKFFRSKGYKARRVEVVQAADAIAEYINMSNNYMDEGYTIEEWYNDTKFNYPEELNIFR